MYKPTRARGDDTPHTLDLVITEFFYKICYESHLGTSDHSLLIFDCKVHTSKTSHTVKRALSKGNYDGLSASLKMDWISMLHQPDSNVEAIWQLFKGELEDKIDEFVPTANNFNPKKESWTRTFDITVRQKKFGQTSSVEKLFENT